MKFDQDLEGLVYTGQEALTKNQEASPKINTAPCQPFTPEYAEWLGENVELVQGKTFDEARNAARNLAGNNGMLLSTADLSFAHKEIWAGADKRLGYSLFHDAIDIGISGLTYEVSGLNPSISGKPQEEKPLILVLHGMNLFGSYDLYIDPYTKKQVKICDWNDFMELWSGYDPKSNRFPANRAHAAVPESRAYGLVLPYDDCTRENFIKVFTKGGTRPIHSSMSQVFPPMIEVARAGGSASYHKIQDIYEKISRQDYHSASDWQERKWWHKLGWGPRPFTVRPVKFRDYRNWNSDFGEETIFAFVRGT